MLTDERETCILLMALRTRAVGFDPTWLPMPQPPQDPFPSASRPNDQRRAAEVAFRELLADAGGLQLMDGAPLVSAVAALEERQLLGGEGASSARPSSRLLLGRAQDVVSRAFGGVMGWARWVFRSGLPPFFADSLPQPIHEADTAALRNTSNDPQELPDERAVPVAQPAERYLVPALPRSAASRDELLIRQAPSSSVEHHRSSKHEVAEAAAASDGAAALPPRAPGRQLLATAAPPQLLGAESLSTQASGSALGVPPAENEAATVARRRRIEAAAIDSLYPGYSFVPMYGRAVSPNCNFSLDVAFTVASIDSNRFEIKVLLYSLFVLGVALALLFATFHGEPSRVHASMPCRAHPPSCCGALAGAGAAELVASMSETFAFRVSMVSISINMLADGAMFLAHVFFAFSQVQAVMMGRAYLLGRAGWGRAYLRGSGAVRGGVLRGIWRTRPPHPPPAAVLASSLLFLMLFSFLGMRLLLMVEKARHPERYAGGAAALTSRMWAMQRVSRKRESRPNAALRTRAPLNPAVQRCHSHLAPPCFVQRTAVAVVLVAGVMLEGRGWGLLVLTLAACSFWLPQIIHSARHNARPGVTPMYLWGSTIARLAVPVYLLACPNNIAWFIVPPEPQNAALAWAAAAAAAPPAQPFAYAPDAVHALLRLRAGTAPAFATPDGEALFFREATFAAVLACWMLAQAVVVFFQVRRSLGHHPFSCSTLPPALSRRIPPRSQRRAGGRGSSSRTCFCRSGTTTTAALQCATAESSPTPRRRQRTWSQQQQHQQPLAPLPQLLPPLRGLVVALRLLLVPTGRACSSRGQRSRPAARPRDETCRGLRRAAVCSSPSGCLGNAALRALLQRVLPGALRYRGATGGLSALQRGTSAYRMARAARRPRPPPAAQRRRLLVPTRGSMRQRTGERASMPPPPPSTRLLRRWLATCQWQQHPSRVQRMPVTLQARRLPRGGCKGRPPLTSTVSCARSPSHCRCAAAST